MKVIELFSSDIFSFESILYLTVGLIFTDDDFLDVTKELVTGIKELEEAHSDILKLNSNLSKEDREGFIKHYNSLCTQYDKPTISFWDNDKDYLISGQFLREDISAALNADEVFEMDIHHIDIEEASSDNSCSFLLYITYAFNKKSQKTPRTELKKANDYRKIYLQRKRGKV